MTVGQGPPVRRPAPFSPAWFARHLLALAAGVAVMVGLDAVTGGADTITWSIVVVFVVVVVVGDVLVGLGQRQQLRAVRADPHPGPAPGEG